MPLTDPGLDERVCRKLGWKGVHWSMYVVGDQYYDLWRLRNEGLIEDSIRRAILRRERKRKRNG